MVAGRIGIFLLTESTNHTATVTLGSILRK